LSASSIRVAVVVGGYPPEEFERRATQIRSYSGDGLEVDVVGVTPSPYVPGFTSRDAVSAVPEFVEGFRRAQEAGFDAVLPLGILDIGVDEGRRAVDIPVVGAFEALMHMAAFFGRKVGVMTYNAGLVPSLQAHAARYHVQELICGYGHVGYEMPDFVARQHLLEDAFCNAAKKLIRAGAEVIACAGISLCPVHLQRAVLQQRLGLPVVEAIEAPVAMAAMLARLRRAR
jgi:allantoin racemase